MVRQPERPIRNKGEDALERGLFVTRLVDALVNSAGQATGVVVGLTGQWGSGKSSILNLLDEAIRERHRNAYVVRFDPWLVSGRDDLILEFFEEIMATIADESDWYSWSARSATRALAKYAKIMAPTAAIADPMAVPFVSSVAEAVLEFIGRRDDRWFNRDERIEKVRDRVSRRLQSLKGPLVVLVDELDRIEDDEIRAVAQFVRAVVDFKGVSYVLAYDAKRVIQALGSGVPDADRGERGRHYLEKIVQLPISIPIVFLEELTRMLNAELRALADAQLPDQFEELPRYQELTHRLVVKTVCTPRDTKRVVGAFNVLRGLVKNEVDWIDLLGFVVLAAKYPKTTELIRDDVERYVDNPLSSKEQLRRFNLREIKRTDVFEGQLDPSEDAEELRWLMGRLFPTLGDGRSQRDAYPDPVSHRRALLTVLRLGLVPGAASRDLVEEALTATSERVVEILAESTVRDEIGSLLDRVDDVYWTHEDVHHVHFWRGVAHYLKRLPKSQPVEVAQFANIVDNLGDILPRAVRRRESLRESAREVFQDLAERYDDLTLVPNWLREQMWAHGVYDLRARGGETWYTQDETTWWCDRLSAIWKQRFLQENLFKQTWDLHWAYAMLQSRHWDEDCRQRFTQLISDDETFDNAILMMFGGMYVTGKDAVGELCDPVAFWNKVEERAAGVNVPPHVRQAIEKAKSRDWD